MFLKKDLSKKTIYFIIGILSFIAILCIGVFARQYYNSDYQPKELGTQANTAANQIAVKINYPQGSFLYGDKTFTFRFIHPNNTTDALDSIASATPVKPDFIVWGYPANAYDKAAGKPITYKAFTDKSISALGLKGYQTALPIMVDSSESIYDSGSCYDYKGNKVIVPWLSSIKRTFADINTEVINTRIQSAIRKYATDQTTGNTLYLHHDNYLTNYEALGYGGCFNPESMTAFTSYLNDNGITPQTQRDQILSELSQLPSPYVVPTTLTTFNYQHHLQNLISIYPETNPNRPPINAQAFNAFINWKNGGLLKQKFIDFQKQSTINYYKKLKAYGLDYMSKTLGMTDPKIILSGNIYYSQIEKEKWAIDGMDLLQSEVTAQKSPWIFFDIFNTTRKSAKMFVAEYIPEATISGSTWSLTSQQIDNNFMNIASIYSLGGIATYPWDRYMGSKNGASLPRYYGEFTQWGSIYDYVGKNRSLFDGYENVFSSFDNRTQGKGSIQSIYSSADGTRTVIEMLNKETLVGSIDAGSVITIKGTQYVTKVASTAGYIYLEPGLYSADSALSKIKYGDAIEKIHFSNTTPPKGDLTFQIASETDMPIISIGQNSASKLISLRAVPNNPKACVVTHVVDWASNFQPFQLRIKNNSFFDTGTNFNVKIHHLDNSVANIATIENKTNGLTSTLTIPAIHPWATLEFCPIEPTPTPSPTPTPTPTDINLITNPKFEQGSVANWFVESKNRNIYIRSVTPGYDDQYSGMVNFVKKVTTNIYSNRISIEPNQKYKLTFYAKNTAKKKFKISVLKANTLQYLGLNEDLKISNKWQQYNFTFTSNNTEPINDARLGIYASSSNAKGKLYIDNIVLTKL